MLDNLNIPTETELILVSFFLYLSEKNTEVTCKHFAKT